MANYRDTLIKDQYAYDDELNPATSYYDIIRPRTTLDAVFDDMDENEKTLRDILAEMQYDIATGSGVEFPVTSVNNKKGDVWILPDDLGLGNVNNTADMDKPLSTPQEMQVDAKIQAAIDGMGQISFPVISVNGMQGNVLITTDSLNNDNSITNLINTKVAEAISVHNNNLTAHNEIITPIKNDITNLHLADVAINTRIDTLSSGLTSHMNSPDAHDTVFATREKISNKMTVVAESSNRGIQYPSVGAIIDYVTSAIQAALAGGTPGTGNIERLVTVRYLLSESVLPAASETLSGYMYFIENMDITAKGKNGIAVNIMSNNNPTYVKFPIARTIFKDGLTIDPIDGGVKIDATSLLTGLNLETGTMNGTITLVYPDGVTKRTASVFGLKPLAFKDKIVTNDITDSAVNNSKLANMEGYTIKGNNTDSSGVPLDIKFEDILKSDLIKHVDYSMNGVSTVKEAFTFMMGLISTSTTKYMNPMLTIQDQNNNNWIYEDIISSHSIKFKETLQMGFTVKKLVVPGTSSGKAIFLKSTAPSINSIRIYNNASGTKGIYKSSIYDGNNNSYLYDANNPGGSINMSDINIAVGDYIEVMWIASIAL